MVVAPAVIISAAARFVATAAGVRALMNISQSAAEGFNFPLVAQLLALGEFHQFQDIFHLIHRAFQRLHDFHHFVNCLADGRTMMRGFGVGGALNGHPLGQALDALEQRLRLRDGEPWCWGGEGLGCDRPGLWRHFRIDGR